VSLIPQVQNKAAPQLLVYSSVEVEAALLGKSVWVEELTAQTPTLVPQK